VTIGPGFTRLNDTYRADKTRRSAAPLLLPRLTADGGSILAAPAGDATALALMQRQFQQQTDGQWARTVDPRLTSTAASAAAQLVVADEPTTLSLLQAVECPVLQLTSAGFEEHLRSVGATSEWLALLPVSTTQAVSRCCVMSF
jgi:hypothetical protein